MPIRISRGRILSLMEDLPVPDFSVKSIVHNYNVYFTSDSENVLKGLLQSGDLVIIDAHISEMYPGLMRIASSDNKVITVTATESQKSYEALIPIIKTLIDHGFRKNHRLIAIGGGITQDITAFTASILYRGVDWSFFPTTLLAQGDSCIGSKTSINFQNFKNQVGGFYPPNNIYIDANFLKTLSRPDLLSGLGEMSHYFVIAGEDDFNRYKRDYPKALKDYNVVNALVARSLEIKKGYIELDEFDRNERQIFNYGHSFGHAIESLTNYSVPHGIAVSIGMDMANFVSVKMGLMERETRMEIRELLEKIWVDHDIRVLDQNLFLKALSKDKKNVGSELRLILCRGYGDVFKAAVSPDQKFWNWMNDYFTNEL